MKNSTRREISTLYASGHIVKSKDNEVVDVSSSMISFLSSLPVYVAPSALNRKVTSGNWQIKDKK